MDAMVLRAVLCCDCLLELECIGRISQLSRGTQALSASLLPCMCESWIARKRPHHALFALPIIQERLRQAAALSLFDFVRALSPMIISTTHADYSEVTKQQDSGFYASDI